MRGARITTDAGVPIHPLPTCRSKVGLYFLNEAAEVKSIRPREHDTLQLQLIKLSPRHPAELPSERLVPFVVETVFVVGFSRQKKEKRKNPDDCRVKHPNPSNG